MKQVSGELNNYLNNERHFLTCDLYRLALANGSIYYFCDFDVDLAYDGKVWEHNKGIFSRDQVKLSGEPTVDNMTITIACDRNDMLSTMQLMKAAHDGVLSGSNLTLYKAYFRADNTVVGVVTLFNGLCEVSSAGGLIIKLTCKSYVQGLSQSLPVRIFAPQSAYAVVNGTVTTSSTDTTTMQIPLKPSQRVLVKL